MILDKLKSLKTVKTIASNRKSSNNTKTKKDNKAPHTFMCEVLILSNRYHIKTKEKILPLTIREEDWVKAEYAYSTEENSNWEPHTLRKFKYDYYYSDYMKKYWSLIKPNLRIRAYCKDDEVRIDMNHLNEKHSKISSKLNYKYYATYRTY